MLLLEVANDVNSSQDEGGVIRSICPFPLYGALAFDPLYMDITQQKLIKHTTSESHLCPLNYSVWIDHCSF